MFKDEVFYTFNTDEFCILNVVTKYNLIRFRNYISALILTPDTFWYNQNDFIKYYEK